LNDAIGGSPAVQEGMRQARLALQSRWHGTE